MFQTNNVLRVHWKQLNALKECAIKHNCSHVRPHKAHTHAGSIKWWWMKMKTANVVKRHLIVANVRMEILKRYWWRMDADTLQSRCHFIMMKGFMIEFKVEIYSAIRTRERFPSKWTTSALSQSHVWFWVSSGSNLCFCLQKCQLFIDNFGHPTRDSLCINLWTFAAFDGPVYPTVLKETPTRRHRGIHNHCCRDNKR